MNFFHLFAFLFLAFAFQSCSFETKKTSSEEPNCSFVDSTFYLGGIQINEPDLEKWTSTLKEVGMNTVEVTAYCKQWYWNTADLEIVKEHGLVDELKIAKQKGLKTIFITRVQLQHWYPENHFLWHGMIMPSTDSLIDEWFRKYKEFNVHWAAVCEKEDVDVMVLGSEMNALASTDSISKMPGLYDYYEDCDRQYSHENRIFKYEKELKARHLWVKGKENYSSVSEYLEDKILAHHAWSRQVTFRDSTAQLVQMNRRRKRIKAHWIDLIEKVRRVYSGKLSYAANFDNYQDVDFWEHLDFVGINAYFPLRKPAKEIPAIDTMFNEFKGSWQGIFDEIQVFQKEKNIEGKPVLFTELGYTNTANSTLESWAGQGFSVIGEGENEQLMVWEDQPNYPFERYLAVKALQRISRRHPVHLNGILYWKLTSEGYLLREEPFGLHIYPWNESGLQITLTNFLK